MKKDLLMFTLLAAPLSGTACAGSAATKQSLAKPGMQSADTQPSPVSGMSTALADSGALHVTDDGKRIIQGPMYNVSSMQPVSVTNQLLVDKLSAPDSEVIVYKAPKKQHIITVFTNITYGYCHKLREQMSDYNALGITARYLVFPRQGLQSQAEQDMKAIWCARGRSKALDDAMDDKGMQSTSYSVDIARHYTLGVQMGVNGIPAVVLSNGMVLPGYQGPKELKTFLNEHEKQASDNWFA